jgi:malyl-CoA/(S)-citramalyl-CoA lyase
MSFTIIEPATARLNRSELAVPGSNPVLFEKAAASAADVVFLDLEDAVAPDDKVQARKNVVEAIRDVDWGAKTLSLRINGLDTHYMYRDVVDVIEQGGDRLDLIMIPKVGTAADVYALDMLVTQVEDAVGRKKRIGFGPNALYGVLTDPGEEGSPRDYHWGDMWHYPIARMVVAARAYGLRPIDGPFGDFSDPDGFRAQAYRAAVLGCEGKWAIHPSQIAPANEVNSPSEAEVTQAKRILEAMEQATREGKGAVALDGRLIDIASIKQAEVLVQKAAQIAADG